MFRLSALLLLSSAAKQYVSLARSLHACRFSESVAERLAAAAIPLTAEGREQKGV